MPPSITERQIKTAFTLHRQISNILHASKAGCYMSLKISYQEQESVTTWYPSFFLFSFFAFKNEDLYIIIIYLFSQTHVLNIGEITILLLFWNSIHASHLFFMLTCPLPSGEPLRCLCLSRKLVKTGHLADIVCTTYFPQVYIYKRSSVPTSSSSFHEYKCSFHLQGSKYRFRDKVLWD